MGFICRRFIAKLVFLLVGCFASSASFAITCIDLNGAYVKSQDFTPVYLGFFGTSVSYESINNTTGPHGSGWSSTSVRNSSGSYGSNWSIYSAENTSASTPPVIYKDNVVIGLLTTNSTITGGVSLSVIDSSCSFTASIKSDLPAPLASLSASAGVTSANLAWASSAGATGYNIFNCNGASCASPTLVGDVSGTSVNITALSPSQLYWFAVQPFNSSGGGSAGFTSFTTLADSVAPVISGSIVSSINEGATALGSVTANETVTWSISGSGVSISSSGVVTLDSAADYETATSHSFTITATDSDSNAANTGTLTVAVVDADENAPVITLVGNVMIMHPLGLIYTDAGATASDDVDGNIEVATSGNVDVTLPGVYIITYSATDSAGNQAIELERIVTVSNITYSLDLDGNGQYDALTDGLLLLRGMFGLDGSALVTGTIASDATYTESVDIESRIATLGDLADIDGNGEIDALTDGLLTLRYLFGLQGDTLINGVVASDATRKTSEEIEAHLETLMPAL